jgi:hypothetical protein
MNEKRLFHRRCFLNDETGAAMLEAYVDDNSWVHAQTQERHASYDGSMQITDCSRSVSLEFSFSDVEDARQQLRKLDRLIDAAQDMRAVIVRSAKREWPGKKV